MGKIYMYERICPDCGSNVTVIRLDNKMPKPNHRCGICSERRLHKIEILKEMELMEGGETITKENFLVGYSRELFSVPRYVTNPALIMENGMLGLFS